MDLEQCFRITTKKKTIKLFNPHHRPLVAHSIHFDIHYITQSAFGLLSDDARRSWKAKPSTHSNKTRDINVRHASLVLNPVIAVLLRASMFVTERAVDDHDGKER